MLCALLDVGQRKRIDALCLCVVWVCSMNSFFLFICSSFSSSVASFFHLDLVLHVQQRFLIRSVYNLLEMEGGGAFVFPKRICLSSVIFSFSHLIPFYLVFDCSSSSLLRFQCVSKVCLLLHKLSRKLLYRLADYPPFCSPTTLTVPVPCLLYPSVCSDQDSYF